MRNRRAPKALVQNLLTEALNYAVALQLMALTLRTLKDDRNDAVHRRMGDFRSAGKGAAAFEAAQANQLGYARSKRNGRGATPARIS
jgi:hypothetical protein